MRVLALGALGLLVGCAAPHVYVPPEALPRFRLEAVALDDASGALALRDIDGDGRPDVVLAGEQTLQILRATGALTPWRRVPVPADVMARQWRTGRVPRRLWVTPVGVRSYDAVADRSGLVVDLALRRFRAGTPGLTLSLGDDDREAPRGTEPLVGGALMLPVAGQEGWSVLRETGGRWQVVDTVEAASDDDRPRLPDRALADIDGDGRPDLVLFERTAVRIHRRGADGRLPRAPSAVLTAADIGAEADASGALDARVADLDGDGVQDLVLFHGKSGRVGVWQGHPGRRSGWGPPDAQLTVEGAKVIGPLLADPDDDGHLDLLFASLGKPGVFGALWSVAVGGTLGLDVRLLEYRGVECGYPAEPSAQHPLAIELDVGAARSGALRKTLGRVGKLGDFDRDGRPDVLMLSEDGASLQLFFNVANQPEPLAESEREEPRRKALALLGDTLGAMTRLPSRLEGRRPDAQLALPDGPYRKLTAVRGDLAGDGQPDLVIQAFPRDEERPVRLFVVWQAPRDP